MDNQSIITSLLTLAALVSVHSGEDQKLPSLEGTHEETEENNKKMRAENTTIK